MGAVSARSYRSNPRRKREKELGQLDRSLSEFFEADVRRQVLGAKGANPRNIDQYRESLKLWEELTGKPSLWQLIESGRELAADFLMGLRYRRWRDEPLAPNTIRKHCVHVQAILDLAGPPSRHNPCALGLIDSPPWLVKPRVEIPEVDDVFTLDEIAAQVDAADAVPRSWYWRNLFVFAYNSAFRCGTLFALERKWLAKDELGNWANVPGVALKGGRGRRFYLNAAAMQALAPLLATKRDKPLSRPVEKSWFYHTLHALQDAAGLPADRHFGLHAFRKTCVTELVKINPLAASWHAGHKTPNITRDHYTHPRAMVAAIDMLPQPPLDKYTGRQKQIDFSST